MITIIIILISNNNNNNNNNNNKHMTFLLFIYLFWFRLVCNCFHEVFSVFFTEVFWFVFCFES